MRISSTSLSQSGEFLEYDGHENNGSNYDAYNGTNYDVYEEEVERIENEEVVISPYRWHEGCICTGKIRKWFPKERKVHVTYFCKLACDADEHCKGYFSTGWINGSHACAIVTTKSCQIGCFKYSEGNRGEIARNVPFAKIVGKGKFIDGPTPMNAGCYAKIR